MTGIGSENANVCKKQIKLQRKVKNLEERIYGI